MSLSMKGFTCRLALNTLSVLTTNAVLPVTITLMILKLGFLTKATNFLAIPKTFASKQRLG